MCVPMTTPAAAQSTARAADRLKELESVIERGLSTFVEVGRALAVIRQERLFLATHSAFKAYVADRWGFGDQSAYARVYASQVADAITGSGAPLPAGISQDAVKPADPAAQPGGTRRGRAGVESVEQQRGDAHRPPSAGDVRAALTGAGFITSAPPKPKGLQLEPVSDRLRTAIRRVEGIGEQLGGKPLPPGTRTRVAELAALARQLADLLDGLADVSRAAARLQALEPDPPPAPKPELQARQRAALASHVASAGSISRPSPRTSSPTCVSATGRAAISAGLAPSANARIWSSRG